MGSKESKARKKATCFFPKLHNERLLLHILEYMLPHDVIKIQYMNTYIYAFVNDEMIWNRICKFDLRRLHRFNESTQQVMIIYPGFKESVTVMPINTGKVRIEIPSLFHSIETYDHRFFLLGGQVKLGKKFISVASTYEFKERRCKLVERTRMTLPRCRVVSVCVCEDIYAIGGEDQGEYLTCCEKYTLQTDTWYCRMNATVPIRDASASSFRDAFIYVFYPKTKNSLGVQRYDVNANLWQILSCSLCSSYQIDFVNFCVPTCKQDEVLVFGNFGYFRFDMAAQLCPYVSSSFLKNERISRPSLLLQKQKLYILPKLQFYICDIEEENISMISEITSKKLHPFWE